MPVASTSKISKPNENDEVENEVLDVHNSTNYNPFLSKEARILAKKALSDALDLQENDIDLDKLYEDTKVFMRQLIHEDPRLSVKELRKIFKWLKSVS